jgi:class 3 adenylate cyclase/tetratricopeptide (TPR) repeat protein
VGSTALSEQLDPEDLRELVRELQRRIGEVVHAFEGHVAQYLGDGVLVYFGYPRALEDAATRALRAGLRIVERVGELGARDAAGVGVAIAVRIGIHTGPVVIGEVGAPGRREQLALGETPNVAARLQQAAPANGLLASRATLELAPAFETESELEIAVKGLSRPIRAALVRAERPRLVAESLPLTPLIGREPDLGLLLECWQRVEEGRGQGVLIRGEPGIGKSRLLAELRLRLEGRPHGWLQVHCSPLTRTSFLGAVVELRSDRVGLHAARAQDGHAPSHRGSPQRERERLLDELERQILAWAASEPLVLALEDAHWADPALRELLARLIEDCATARLLLVATSRPELAPDWPSLSYLATVTLDRLAPAQVRMLGEQVARRPLEAQVLRQVSERADGVPLFVEELTKAALGPGGREGVIPATLQDSLMARLDRMGEARRVMQIASVFGREFSSELLEVVAQLDPLALDEQLDRLVAAELLYRRGRGRAALYTFKHALIEEAAYGSMLRTTRRRMHGRLAGALRSHAPELCAAQPERLAHHLTEAGETREAAEAWLAAAARALERFANEDAMAHATRGIELLPGLSVAAERDLFELRLQSAYGAAAMAARGYASAEVEDAYSRALELCRRVEGTPLLFPVLRGLYVNCLLRADLASAGDLANELSRITELSGDTGHRVESLFARGQVELFRGDLDAAQATLELGVEAYDDEAHRSHVLVYGQDPGVFCLQLSAWAYWARGYPSQALARLAQARSLAERIGNPNTLASSHYFSSWLAMVRDDVEEAREAAELALGLAREHALPMWDSAGSGVLAWLRARGGDLREGTEGLARAIDALRSNGAELVWPMLSAELARLRWRCGDVAAARRELLSAVEITERRGQTWHVPELHRVLGELGYASDRGEGERHLLRALEMAHTQGALALELRAAASLLHRRASEEDRVRLEQLILKFPEPDAPDLAQARALAARGEGG